MDEAWLTVREVSELIGHDKREVLRALTTAKAEDLVWARPRSKTTTEYQVRREVRDSIRQTVSSRIRVLGQ